MNQDDLYYVSVLPGELKVPDDDSTNKSTEILDKICQKRRPRKLSLLEIFRIILRNVLNVFWPF